MPVLDVILAGLGKGKSDDGVEGKSPDENGKGDRIFSSAARLLSDSRRS
jgi:hypothetical protein